MGECKICHGHGYYYIHADAAGTANDKKKACKACWGTGLGVCHTERAKDMIDKAIVDQTEVNWDMIEDAITTALASAESDLLKRMMQPSVATIEAGRLAIREDDKFGAGSDDLKAQSSWHFMLRAFATENNIDLEVEDVDG